MNGPFPSRGSALILVIWCVLILSIAILGAGRLVEQGISSQRLASHRFDAKQFALTGIAYGLDPKIEKEDPLLDQKMGIRSKLRVTIGSEGGKLNVNHQLAQVDNSALLELFRLWGVPEDEARTTVDCLKDWMDPGELRSLNGAERSDLVGTPYSLPENRPFLTVAEMRGVKGMDRVESVKPDWAESLSVLSGERLDIQEVDANFLKVFGKLTSAQAESIVAYRAGSDKQAHTKDDVQIKSMKQLPAIAGMSASQFERLERNFQIGGSPVRIESTGTAGGAEYTVTAIVAERNPSASLLWWEEK